MASVNFSVFLSEVMPHVPGCADIVAINAIRNAAIEFCEQSAVWKVKQAPVIVAPNEWPMTISAPENSRVVNVISLCVDGIKIPASTVEQLDSAAPAWRNQLSDGVRSFYQQQIDQVSVFPAQTGNKSIEIVAAYAPTRTATSMESWIYQQYMEFIASGAIARLMTIPGQAWNNADLSMYHQNNFVRGIAQAKLAAMRSFGRTSISMRPRPFI